MAKLILSDDIAYENLILFSAPKLRPGTDAIDFSSNNLKQKSHALLILLAFVILLRRLFDVG